MRALAIAGGLLIPVPLIRTQESPSYPSEYAVAAAAASSALGICFQGGDTVGGSREGGGLSTVYSGIHFQSDVDQGLSLGAAAGQAVVNHAGVAPFRISNQPE